MCNVIFFPKNSTEKQWGGGEVGPGDGRVSEALAVNAEGLSSNTQHV